MNHSLVIILVAVCLGCSNKQSSTSAEAAVAKTPATESRADDAFIYGELIVKIDKEVELKDILSAFIDIELSLKESIAARSGLYLLSYDARSIDNKAVLDHVRSHEAVVEVECNKRLQSRD